MNALEILAWPISALAMAGLLAWVGLRVFQVRQSANSRFDLLMSKLNYLESGFTAATNGMSSLTATSQALANKQNQGLADMNLRVEKLEKTLATLPGPASSGLGAVRFR